MNSQPSIFFTVFAVAVVAILAAGCGSPCAGKERCACYGNGTCNPGLTCLSKTCVNSGAADAGGGDIGTTGTGGSDMGSGGADPGTGGANTGSGGTAGRAAGTGGASGATSSGGSGGRGIGGSGGTGDGGLCRVFEVRPETTVPTVFVLVDRSGSMFDCIGGLPDSGVCTNNSWITLRDGILPVVQQLQSQMRFAFGAFTGEIGMTCPIFDSVGAALNNHAAIAAAYTALGRPTKGETPTVRALGLVKGILDTDAGGGPKYILFVTDGQPDYCGDGNEICPLDGVVYQLQSLKAAGVTTLVFGVQSPLTTISGSTLQAFANAGAGQPVLSPTASPGDIYFQCFSNSMDANALGWKQDYVAAGKTGTVPLGSYGADGTATLYRPNPENPQALTDLFASAISNVKSCLFDLANGLTADLNMLDRASVVIQGTTVPRDAANGWNMISETRLQLSGSACQRWRQPDSRTIDFQFPCGIIKG